jgi:acetyl-CoA C-acetyltransferase
MMVASQFGITTRSAAARAGRRATAMQEVNQFLSAQRIAEKWDLSRAAMEAFSLESHERAIRADRRGPLRPRDPALHAARRTCFADEGPRPGARSRRWRTLKTVPGRTASRPRCPVQICDASAALLVAREAAVKQHGLKPRARIHHLSVREATIPSGC